MYCYILFWKFKIVQCRVYTLYHFYPKLSYVRPACLSKQMAYEKFHCSGCHKISQPEDALFLPYMPVPSCTVDFWSA